MRGRQIVKPRWGSGWVLGLVAGGIGLMVLLAGGGIALYWALRTPDTLSSKMAEPEWQTFTVPGANATILMLGTPRFNEVAVGGVPFHKHHAQRQRDGAIFLIAHGEVPALVPLNDFLERAYDAELDNLVQASGATTAREKDVRIKGHAGKECEIRATFPMAATYVLRLFVVQVGGRYHVYELLAGGNGMKVGEGEMAEFLDSFQLNAAPVEK